MSYTKLNFILGQCSKAEIQAGPLWRWLLVNTGWTNYKIQSVLVIMQYSGSALLLSKKHNKKASHFCEAL